MLGQSVHDIIANRQISPGRTGRRKNQSAAVLRKHQSWVNRLCLSAKLAAHNGCVNTIHWNKAGTILVSGADDRCVKLWEVRSAWKPALLHSMPTLHQHNIFDAQFVPHAEDQVVTTAADGMVGLVNVEGAASPSLLFENGRGGPASKFDFQPGSSHIFLATFSSGHVRLFDLREESQTKSFPIIQLPVGVTGLAFNPYPSSTIFAIGCDDPILRLCDLRMFKAQSHTRKKAHARNVLPFIVIFS